MNTEEDDMEAIGRTRWALAEGYLPPGSNGPAPQMISHETLCLLNTSDQDADIRITVYFADREPAGPYRLSVPARRTKRTRAPRTLTVPCASGRRLRVAIMADSSNSSRTLNWGIDTLTILRRPPTSTAGAVPPSANTETASPPRSTAARLETFREVG